MTEEPPPQQLPAGDVADDNGELIAPTVVGDEEQTTLLLRKKECSSDVIGNSTRMASTAILFNSMRVCCVPGHDKQVRDVKLTPEAIVFKKNEAFDVEDSFDKALPSQRLRIANATLIESTSGTGFTVAEAKGVTVSFEIEDTAQCKEWIERIREQAALNNDDAAQERAASPASPESDSTTTTTTTVPTVPNTAEFDEDGASEEEAEGLFDPFNPKHRINNFEGDAAPAVDQDRGVNVVKQHLQNAVDYVQTEYDKVCFITTCQVDLNAPCGLESEDAAVVDSGQATNKSNLSNSAEVTTAQTLFSMLKKSLIVEALLMFTKCRVIVCTSYQRNAHVHFDFHLWNILRVSVNFVAKSISFHLRDGTATIFVSSPSFVIRALNECLSRITPVRMLPEILGMPNWPLFLSSSNSAKTTGVPMSWRPLKILDPIDLYVAQCSYLKRNCNPLFIQYLTYLMETGQKSLDLTTSFVCGDDDAPTCIGFLAYDVYFRGLLVAHKPVADALTWIGRVMSRNKHLTLLVARYVDANERQVLDMLDSLCNSRNHSLCSIDLSGNALRDSGAKLLGSALSQVSHSMVSLKISNCGISARGMQLIFAGLLNNLSASVVLGTLDVSYNRLEETGALALNKWISAMISEIPHLRSLGLGYTRARLSQLTALSELHNLNRLDIRGLDIDDVTVSILTKPLCLMKALDISECVFKKSRAVSVLMQSFFSGKKKNLFLKMDNAIVAESRRGGVAPVAHNDFIVRSLMAIPMRETLQRLGVANCGGMLPVLLAALNESSALEVFESSCHGSHETMDLSLALAFSSLITSCPHLTVLRLINGYNEEVIRPLLEQLQKPCSVRCLDIENNSLSDEIMQDVAELLSKNSSLVSLHLKGNNIKPESLKLLVPAIQSNVSICEVDIVDDAANHVSDYPDLADTISDLQKVFSRNATTTQKQFLEKVSPSMQQFFVNASESSRSWHSYLPASIIASNVSYEAAPPLASLSTDHSGHSHHGFLRKHHKHT